METKDIILELRNRAGMSQEELAEKVYVTRQAVSRWENGETIPNTDTLKLLSKLFDVSINTLLGSPRKLICQCCGMPLDDSVLSREPGGTFNEEYCKWCYTDGEFVYDSFEKLLDFLSEHMADEKHPSEQVRAYMQDFLPKLNHWNRYIALGGDEKFGEFKGKLIEELNALQIEGMPKIENLKLITGNTLNLIYRLPNGNTVEFLDDDLIYLGAQLECIFGGERQFGVVADMDFLLVCSYDKNGKAPELILYKKR